MISNKFRAAVIVLIGSVTITSCYFPSTPSPPPTPLVFVTSLSSNSAYPINSSNNSIGSAISVGLTPSQIAATASGADIYITNQSNGTVSEIDTNKLSIIGSPIAVGKKPFGIAICSNGTAYVANTGSGSISAIDTGSNSVISTIEVAGSPVGVACSANGSQVDVTSFSSPPSGGSGQLDPSEPGTLTEINTSTNQVSLSQTVGDGPNAICDGSSPSVMYILNSGSNTVSVYSQNGTLLRTISVGTWPVACSISTNGNTLAVSNELSNSLSVINTQNWTVTGTVSTESDPQGVDVGTASTVYVSDVSSNSVQEISLSSLSVVATITGISSPIGVLEVTP